MTYELYYWPHIQGRGEFVRLALEQAGADYLDVGRVHGVEAMVRGLKDAGAARRPFAAPFLKHGDIVVGQTAAILLYLGPRIGLAPADEAGRLWTHQIQLTIADLVGEAHDTHHPIDFMQYYEDQKPEAARRAKFFREARIPKFLGWLEQAIAGNRSGSGWLVGAALTYADLYAFPKATARTLKDAPGLTALCDRVKALPNIAAYLATPRRIPRNNEGIFRHYPELDGD